MANFTEQAIKKSFTELLNDKPLDKITVADIAATCGINRNTFYYHYHDVYELLDAVLREEKERLIDARSDFSTWQSGIAEATRFAVQNKKAVYHIYDSVSRERLETYLYDVSAISMRRFIESQAEGLAVPERDIDDLTVLCTVALEGLLINWLHGGMNEDPHAYLDNMGRLLDGTIRRALERSADSAR